MPTAPHHSRKAKSNREFLDTIDPGKYPDWKATAAFYVAVHRVEELRDMLEATDSCDHGDRRMYIQLHHRPIQRAFQ